MQHGAHYFLVYLFQLLGGCLVYRPDSHPYRVKKYQCRIDTINSPDDGHITAQTCREDEMNILSSNVRLVVFI